MTATGSGYIYRPLPNELRIKNKCQTLARLKGETFLRLLGDMTSATGSRNVEETEIFSNETPDRDLVLVDQTANDFTLTFALRQMTEFAKRVLFQSDRILEAQVAATDLTAGFVGVQVGDMLPLDKVLVKNVVVTAGATDVAMVSGTHYQLDSELGRVQVLAFPVGVSSSNGTNVDVSFDCEAADLPTYGMGSNTDLRAEIVIRQNNKWGPSYEFTFHDVQMRPDGDMTFGGDGTDFNDVTVVGRCYADPSKPAAYRIGVIRQIPKHAVA